MDTLSELELLRSTIKRVREEVAAVRHPSAVDDRLHVATRELEAIVAATEGATNDILTIAEQIDSAIKEIKRDTVDPMTTERASRIDTLVADLFTACGFQDITGQRVSKVVGALEFIEARIEAIIAELGPQTFAGIPVPDIHPGYAEAKLLNGPQIGGPLASQSDIDKLFD